MRVLLVTPVEQGSGETVTALHVAENLVSQGHGVLFLASPFARRFLDARFPLDVWPLGEDGAGNQALWNRALQAFGPDVVLFADYPLLFFPHGVSPLASVPGWVERLDDLPVCLVTLDHFGFAQREMGLFFGPPHLTPFQYQRFPAIPRRMRVMLPCPMHEPGPVDGRLGEPFRYWDLPLGAPDAVRVEVRRQYLGDRGGFLVFHSVPHWAWQAAEALRLAFYRFLPRLLDQYFGPLGAPVTIVSVNNGRLLEPPPDARVRIVNLEPLPTPAFEGLLFGSDLVITENKVSISMGKAICGLQPCAVLKNSFRLIDLVQQAEPGVRNVILAMENARPGTVYPYEVFPSGFRHTLDELVLYQDNALTRAFDEVETYGGEASAGALCRLLADREARADLRARQRVYVDRLARLGDSA